MTLHDRAQHLQDLAASGETIFEAIDTYYADDVEIVEATGETFHGKDTQAQRVRDFFSTVTAMHDGGVRALAVHETADGTGTAFVEAWSDLEFAEGRWMMEEVAVQEWKDGQVVRERFYYTPPPSGDGA